MGDNNVYVYDETNPLEQSQRDVLHYHSQSQDTPTYLVELANASPGSAPQQQTLRSRNTTIVNTSRIPDTIEEEEEPLESYIRQNLPSLRKSIAPESLEPFSRRRVSEKGDNEGSVIVTPMSSKEIQRDTFVDRQNSEKNSVASNQEHALASTSKQNQSNETLNRSRKVAPAPAPTTSKQHQSYETLDRSRKVAPESAPSTSKQNQSYETLDRSRKVAPAPAPTTSKQNQSYETLDRSRKVAPAPTTSKQNQSYETLDRSSKEAPAQAPTTSVSKPHKPTQDVHCKQDIVLLPCLYEPVAVSQQTPFSKAQKELNKRPSSRVRVMIMIDSSDDEDADKDKRSGKAKKHHSNRHKNHNSSEKHTDTKDKNGPTTKPHRHKKSPNGADTVEEETVHPAKGYIPRGSDPNSSKSNKKHSATTSKHRGSQEDKGDARGSKSKHDGSRPDQHVYYSFDDRGHQKGRKNSSSEARSSRHNSGDPKKNVNWTVMMASNEVPFPVGGGKHLHAHDDRLKFDDESDNDSEVSKHYPQTKNSKKHSGISSKSKKSDASRNERLTPDEDDHITKHQSFKSQGGRASKEKKSLDTNNKPNSEPRPRKNKPDSRLDKQHETANRGAERRGPNNPNDPPNYVTVKAPRSATKMIAKKRYLIQIPEHGRDETWFNIQFNMNDENNVDMDYEGPVKVTNYYSSNTYK